MTANNESGESAIKAINPRTIDPEGWYGIYTHERLKQKQIIGKKKMKESIVKKLQSTEPRLLR